MNIASILATKGDKVVTVRADQTIREALGVLAQHNIGALVVVDSTMRPIGILSERDIVRAAAKNESVFPQLVNQLMTRDLVLGDPGDDLSAVGQTMVQRRIRHLPIEQDGRMIGFISIGDLVKYRIEKIESEAEAMRSYIQTA